MAIISHIIILSVCYFLYYGRSSRYGQTKCKDLMLALPTPPKELKRNRSRYKDGKSPGINLLNKYLQELGLPYEIDSSKRELFDGVDKKKTVWTVKYKHAEESSADNHTSTE